MSPASEMSLFGFFWLILAELTDAVWLRTIWLALALAAFVLSLAMRFFERERGR